MVTTSPGTRRVLTAAAVGCGALMTAALAACGSSTPGQASGSGGSGTATMTPSTPASSSASTPTTTATPSGAASKGGGAPMIPATQCPTSSLSITVVTLRGGGAAGTTYVPIDFTNTSGKSCQMYGFPGVSFASGNPGSQLGDAASRVTSYGSEAVTLAPGGKAHAWLGVADAGNFPASKCHQVTAHWLKIFPPDQFSSKYVGYTSQVCSAKITGGSVPLSILPVRSGAAVASVVP